MSYIYIIRNTINQKVYIGKTNLSLEKRFNEHIKDSKKEKYEKRPLYNAMNKYGADKFSIHLIEETNNPEEREIYWIREYDSYKNGYNATLGGDSRRRLDYDLIVSTYNNLGNAKLVSKLLNLDYSGVLNILKSKHINTNKKTRQNAKKVLMFSKDNVLIKNFESAGEAGRYLVSNKIANCKEASAARRVMYCANNQIEYAYGYKWK